MSRSARGRSPGITLFAFQDIIMSTTGILIMIVLLLTLQLTQQPPAAASSDRVADDLDQLRSQIEAAELQNLNYQQQLAAGREMIQSGTQESPDSVNKDIERLQQENLQLAAVNQSMREQRADLLRESGADQPMRDYLATLKRQLNSVRAEQKTLEMQSRQAAGGRTIYSFEKGSQRQGWLAVVSKDRVEVAPIGRPQAPRSFLLQGLLGSASSTASNVVSWAKELPIQEQYLFLLLRPDGVDLFEALESKLVSEGFAYGYDLVDSRTSVLHPERGAAP